MTEETQKRTAPFCLSIFLYTEPHLSAHLGHGSAMMMWLPCPCAGVASLQPFKQPKSWNPEGKLGVDRSAWDHQECWHCSTWRDSLPGKSAIMCKYVVHTGTLWLKAPGTQLNIWQRLHSVQIWSTYLYIIAKAPENLKSLLLGKRIAGTLEPRRKNC